MESYVFHDLQRRQDIGGDRSVVLSILRSSLPIILPRAGRASTTAAVRESAR